MKRIVAAAIFSTLAAAAHADAVAGTRPDLVPGQTFGCEGYVKPVAVLTTRDNAPVHCVVLDDVHATGSRGVVIPKKSQLFGWKKGHSIERTSWTTPDQVFVGDATLHGTAFVSEIDPASESYTVVVDRDIMVPQDERHCAAHRYGCTTGHPVRSDNRR